MLYVFGFDRVGVVVGDLYFVDPAPIAGQEGAEHGVRVELRLINRGGSKGTIYAASAITVDEPVWRLDLLEAVGGKPFDRTHHHPAFTGWDPSERAFVRALSGDPLGWLGDRLADLGGLLAQGHVPADVAGRDDAAELRRATPEIVGVTGRLLDRVRAGELGVAPDPDQPVAVDGRQVLARSGWL